MENKTSKYFKYAIGEIILVVIGILIALQINTWNENRKKTQLERYYLRELKMEFTSNLNALHQAMDKNKTNYTSALKLLDYISDSTINISDSLVNNLLLHSIIGEIEYRPSPGTLNEMINSGKLELISNKDLRSKLSAWDGKLMRVRFQEKEHAYPRIKLIDIVYNKGNFRNGFLDTNYNSFNLTHSTSQISNTILLYLPEFDNFLTSFYLTGIYLNENYYSVLETEIKQAIDLIQSEIKND